MLEVGLVTQSSCVLSPTLLSSSSNGGKIWPTMRSPSTRTGTVRVPPIGAQHAPAKADRGNPTWKSSRDIVYLRSHCWARSSDPYTQSRSSPAIFYSKLCLLSLLQGKQPHYVGPSKAPRRWSSMKRPPRAANCTSLERSARAEVFKCSPEKTPPMWSVVKDRPPIHARLLRSGFK